jgi:hypothetical protein
MPNDDYIPQQDEDFQIWQNEFMTPVAASPAKYGVTAADVTAAQAAQTTWTTAFPAHINARNAAAAATTAKDDARPMVAARSGSRRQGHGPGATRIAPPGRP